MGKKEKNRLLIILGFHSFVFSSFGQNIDSLVGVLKKHLEIQLNAPSPKEKLAYIMDVQKEVDSIYILNLNNSFDTTLFSNMRTKIRFIGKDWLDTNGFSIEGLNRNSSNNKFLKSILLFKFEGDIIQWTSYLQNNDWYSFRFKHYKRYGFSLPIYSLHWYFSYNPYTQLFLNIDLKGKIEVEYKISKRQKQKTEIFMLENSIEQNIYLYKFMFRKGVLYEVYDYKNKSSLIVENNTLKDIIKLVNQKWWKIINT